MLVMAAHSIVFAPRLNRNSFQMHDESSIEHDLYANILIHRRRRCIMELSGIAIGIGIGI